MSDYDGHKCSEPGCESRECACNDCHKCQKHHDEDLKENGRFGLW